MQNAPKKILYVITKGNFGGAQRYVYELALAMREKGHCVVVACGGAGITGGVREKSILIQKLENANVPVEYISSFMRDIRIMSEWNALIELRNIIRRHQPDIIHLNSSKAGLLGAIAARTVGGSHTIIFTAHGWPFLEKRNTLWKMCAWIGSTLTALLVDSVILVSDNGRKHARMPFIQNFSTIHPSVPNFPLLSESEARTRLFSPEFIAEHHNDYWLVTIAELTSNKNLLSAIKAVEMHNAKSNRIFYTIIGDGEQRNELESYIRENKLSDSVMLLGHVDNAREYLKAFDAFLLPSHKEGFPYALLEAGYAARATIGSTVGGIPEIITTGDTGLLTDTDSSAIAAQMEYMTTHKDEAEAMGIKLKSKIKTEFTFEAMVQKTEALYDAMISRAT